MARLRVDIIRGKIIITIKLRYNVIQFKRTSVNDFYFPFRVLQHKIKQLTLPRTDLIL